MFLRRFGEQRIRIGELKFRPFAIFSNIFSNIGLDNLDQEVVSFFVFTVHVPTVAKSLVASGL